MKQMRVVAQPIFGTPEDRIQKASEAVKDALQNLENIRSDLLGALAEHNAPISISEGFGTAVGLLNYAYSQLSGKELSEVLGL